MAAGGIQSFFGRSESMERLINDEADSITIHGAQGLSAFTAALFLIGEMAGSGVLSLPKAVLDAGWIGLVLILVCAVMSAYTGVVLGRCWTILQTRFEKYRQQTRYPYPAIGFEAFGKPGRYIVSFSVNATLFGVGTVFLLLASDNLQNLFKLVNVEVSFCAWLPIVTVVLLPLTWLGTPKDFWPVAMGAMIATSIACLCMFIQILMDTNDYPHPNYPTTNFNDFFFAFGVILFAFGGHAAFPTIQHDMTNPENFPTTVYIAYLGIILMYFPVSAAGFFVYGDQNKDNILDALSSGFLRTTALVMITLHLTMGFIIVVNPLCQEIEEFLGIKTKFNWKRLISRTIVTGVIFFVAESLPHFGAILSLVGGSTVTFLTFVFPSLFYLKLCSTSSPEQKWQKTTLKPYQWILHSEIILVGVIGGVSSTYSAIYSIASGQSQFTVPCYVNATAAHL